MLQQTLYNALIQQGEFEDKLTAEELSYLLSKQMFFVKAVMVHDSSGERIFVSPEYWASSYLTSEKFIPILSSNLDGTGIKGINAWDIESDSNLNVSWTIDENYISFKIVQDAEEDTLDYGNIILDIALMDPLA